MPDLAHRASAAADAADMGVTTRHCLGQEASAPRARRAAACLEPKWREPIQPLIDKPEYS
jgi:hypothetical protein